MSLESDMNFDQRKAFSENYEPIKVFVYKITKKIVVRDISPRSFKLKRVILPTLIK